MTLLSCEPCQLNLQQPCVCNSVLCLKLVTLFWPFAEKKAKVLRNVRAKSSQTCRDNPCNANIISTVSGSAICHPGFCFGFYLSLLIDHFFAQHKLRSGSIAGLRRDQQLQLRLPLFFPFIRAPPSWFVHKIPLGPLFSCLPGSASKRSPVADWFPSTLANFRHHHLFKQLVIGPVIIKFNWTFLLLSLILWAVVWLMSRCNSSLWLIICIYWYPNRISQSWSGLSGILHVESCMYCENPAWRWEYQNTERGEFYMLQLPPFGNLDKWWGNWVIYLLQVAVELQQDPGLYSLDCKQE